MKKTVERISIKNHPLGSLVEELSGNRPNTVNDGGQFLYKSLPPAVVRANEEMAAELRVAPSLTDLNFFAHQLDKTKTIKPPTLASVLQEIIRWNKYDEEKAMALVGATLPRLISMIPLSRTENNEPSLTALLIQLTKHVGEGKVEIDLPMCPPYNYEVHPESGQLRHANGELLPQIGPRFRPTASALQETMRPLSETGVRVANNFITYNGNDIKGLVELGDDVLAHYTDREDEMLGNLAAAFADLAGQVNETFETGQLVGKPVAMEDQIVPGILEIVEDFKRKFTANGETRLNPDNEAMDRWTRQAFDGIGIGLLMYFVEQELNYKIRQRIDLAPEKTVIGGLKEALVYHRLRQRTKDGTIIIDPETTENYMNGPYQHYQNSNMGTTPVAVLKPFSPDSPDNPLAGARQPFNLPKGLENYRQRKIQ